MLPGPSNNHASLSPLQLLKTRWYRYRIYSNRSFLTIKHHLKKRIKCEAAKKSTNTLSYGLV